MLSVALPEIATSWRSFEIGAVASGQTSMPIQIQLATTVPVVEGGYINSAPLLQGTSTSHFLVNFGESSPRSLADLISRDSFLDTNAAVGGWVSVDLFGAGDLVPRVIESNTVDADLSLSVQPAPNDSSHAGVPQEGGLISLKPILGPLRPSVEAKDAESSLVMPTTKSLPTADSFGQAESFDTKRAVREISGEWARAAVFEIAGGEPIADTRQRHQPYGKPLAASVWNSAVRATEPTTFHEVNRNAGRAAAPNAADQNPGSTDSEKTSAGKTINPTVSMTLPTAAVGHGAIGESQNAAPVNDGAIRAGKTPQLPVEPEDIAAAFDKFGSSDLAIPPPSPNGSRLSSWLDGTPLLLMFAFERVTARRSRRRRSTGGAVEVGRPHTR